MFERRFRRQGHLGQSTKTSRIPGSGGVKRIGAATDPFALWQDRLRARLQLQTRAQSQAHLDILVDTSVWSQALRQKNESLSANEKLLVMELAELIREGRARIIGVIRQELLSGIRTAEQYEKLRLYLRAFPDKAIHTNDYEDAAKASNRCRAKGLTSRVRPQESSDRKTNAEK